MRTADPAAMWLAALSQGAKTAIAERTVDGLRVLAAVVTPDLREGGGAWRVDDVLLDGMEARLVVFFTPPDFDRQPQRLMCQAQVYENDALLHDTGWTDAHDARLGGFSNDLFPTRFQMGFDLGPDEIGTTTRFDVSVRDPDRGITVPVSVSFKTRARVLQ